MREYIPNKNLAIDGRNIPYPICDAHTYLVEHDGYSQEDYEYSLDNRCDFVVCINQILALKQSCFLLMHTTHICQSLVDDLCKLKKACIDTLKTEYEYEFDEVWVENMIQKRL